MRVLILKPTTREDGARKLQYAQGDVYEVPATLAAEWEADGICGIAPQSAPTCVPALVPEEIRAEVAAPENRVAPPTEHREATPHDHEHDKPRRGRRSRDEVGGP